MSVSKKAGLPPGALIHVGSRKNTETKINVIDYSSGHITLLDCKNPEECFPFKSSESISWINICGLNDVGVIEKIGKNFNLHPLLLEDVLNTQHRPKFEEFDDYVFISLKMLGVAKDGQSIVSEQISLVMGDSWVISFQELVGDIFNPLRTRLESSSAPLRNKTVDYLLYRLIDTIVDNYFFVTENISDRSEKLEEEALIFSEDNTLKQVQKLKRQIMSVRKAVGPLREAVLMLQKEEVQSISKETNRYLHDVYEHLVQLNDTLDSQREIVGGIMELYLNGVSNKMNQVMQLLTIISTIFIPITFIAGIYGMNFKYMPELEYHNSYYIVWAVMIITIIGMLIYFKRKRWL